MTEIEASDEPYPGLRSFTRYETHIFFGRRSATNSMVDRLAAHHFLAVTGLSGSGKSSLVRTGLLDALDRGLLAAAGADWCVADFRPGQRPLFAMAGALLDATNMQRTEQEVLLTEAVLARGPHGLIDWWKGARLPSESNLLVLADQFEEIFRFRQGRAGDDIDAFVALLLESVKDKTQRIYVVITMRSDFLGECAQFAGLSEIINDAQFLTPRLTRQQRRAAIEEPAAVCGGSVEPRLVNRLLNDTETGADQLPLMQHALMRIWKIAKERAGDGAPLMTFDDYVSLGGIGVAQPPQFAGGAEADGPTPDGALSIHADEILRSLSDERQRLATLLFRALTESEGAGGRDVRHPITLQEAGDIAGVTPDELIPIIEAFRAPGVNFLMPPPGAPLKRDVVIDISHESLIRQWGKLRDWTRDEYRSAETYRHLVTTANLWKNGQAALWTMPDLEIARTWREREKPNAAWAARYGGGFEVAMEFLDRSSEAEIAEVERKLQEAQAALERAQLREREAAARRRARLAVFGLCVFGVVSLAIGVFAFQAEHNYGIARDAVVGFLDFTAKGQQGVYGVRTETIDATLNIVEKTISGLPLLTGDDPILDRSEATFTFQFAKSYKDAGNVDKAFTEAIESLKRRQQLVNGNSADSGLQSDLAESFDLIGDLYRDGAAPKNPADQAVPKDARSAYDSARSIRALMLDRSKDKSRWRNALAQSYTRIGDLDMYDTKAGHLDSAKANYRKSLDFNIANFLEDQKNAEWQRQLSWGYNKFGDFYKATKTIDRAIKDYEKGLCIRRHGAAEYPLQPDWQRDLAFSLEKTAAALLANNDPAGAQKPYFEDLSIRRRLMSSDEGKALYMQDLAETLKQIGALYAAIEKPEVAAAFVQAAVDIGTRLAQNFGDTGSLKRLASTKKLLDDMLKKHPEANDALKDPSALALAIQGEESSFAGGPSGPVEQAACWSGLIAQLKAPAAAVDD